MRRASQRVGYAQTTLQRQLDKGHLTPQMVIALSRAYDRSPVTGLIETGYIEPWETEGVGIPFALEQATNEQILDEIMRRSDPEARALFTAAGDPDTVDIHEDLAPVAEVHHLHHTDTESADTAELYAADSSPDETEERWERGEDPID